MTDEHDNGTEGERGWFPERRRSTGPNMSVVIALAGLTLAFLVQFGGTVWWGATLAANVQNITQWLAKIDSERYTRSDAARDIQRLDERDRAITEQIGDLRGRLGKVEERADSSVLRERK